MCEFRIGAWWMGYCACERRFEVTKNRKPIFILHYFEGSSCLLVAKSTISNTLLVTNSNLLITKSVKLFYVLIAAQGIMENAHSQEVFSQVLTLDDLFD
jgi:hypothetical protein